MTGPYLLLLAVAIVCSVGGQMCLKSAVVTSLRTRAGLIILATAIVLLTLRFFTWLALLARFELSFLYPFESIERILLAVAAVVFLREKFSWRLGFAILLIAVGMLLICGTGTS